MKFFYEFFSPIQQQQQQQQPYIIATTTNLGQIPIILQIIPPLIVTTTTTSLQPTQLALSSLPRQQQSAKVKEQEQKHNANEYMISEAILLTKLFNTSTLMVEGLQQRFRKGEDPFKAPPDVPLPPHIPTTATSDYDNNNYNIEIRIEANPTTINTKKEEKQMEENNYYVEERITSSNSNLIIDNEDVIHDGNSNSSNIDYDNGPDVRCLTKRHIYDHDKIDRNKVITETFVIRENYDLLEKKSEKLDKEHYDKSKNEEEV
jgi:hypothetical protein